MPQFLPGQSGNPSGRPKDYVLPDGRTLRDLVRTHTIEAVETLIGVARDETAPAAARVAAASAILDRGYGKPPVTIADEDGNAMSWASLLTAQARAGLDEPDTIQ